MQQWFRVSWMLATGLGLSLKLCAVPSAPAGPVPVLTNGTAAIPMPAAAAADTNVPPSLFYQLIVDRNPFALRTPPPAPQPDTTGPVVPSALKLTGVTTLLGGTRAMFVVQEPGKTNLFSGLVREGDWDSVITNLQVLSINPKDGIVQVKYGGSEMALNFRDNGIKPAAGPAVPGMPVPMLGRPGMPTMPVQRPIVNPAVQPNPAFNNPGGFRQLPARPSRLGASMDSSAPTQPVLTPDQQLLAIQAQEQLGRQEGIPMPPSPPVGGPTANTAGNGSVTPVLPILPPTPGR